MALDPEERKEVQTNFNAWLEIQERRSELTKENKAITEDAATILNCKKTLVTKMFRILKKRMDDEGDELADLTELIEEMES